MFMYFMNPTKMLHRLIDAKIYTASLVFGPYSAYFHVDLSKL